jgi:hypothetical protein
VQFCTLLQGPIKLYCDSTNLITFIHSLHYGKVIFLYSHGNIRGVVRLLPKIPFPKASILYARFTSWLARSVLLYNSVLRRSWKLGDIPYCSMRTTVQEPLLYLVHSFAKRMHCHRCREPVSQGSFYSTAGSISSQLLTSTKGSYQTSVTGNCVPQIRVQWTRTVLILRWSRVRDSLPGICSESIRR